MKKSLILAALAFAMPGIMPGGSAGVFRDEQTGEGGDTGGGETTKGRKVSMDDGRELTFGEKQKIRKSSGVEGDNVFCRIDFDNGKTVAVFLPAGNLISTSQLTEPKAADGGTSDGVPTAEAKAAKMSLMAMGHGLEQKLGDAAAGADSTDDALEAILEVAARINKGDWNKGREGGSTSAKGASELVQALVVILGQSKEQVREMLSNLNAGEKAALRVVPDVKTEIEKIKAAKAPSKAEQEKAAKASQMLEALKLGQVPPKTEEQVAA